jgi:ABC-type transport system involved in cytochrome bd biosynthesis fused ATPase/permease subunit
MVIVALQLAAMCYLSVTFEDALRCLTIDDLFQEEKMETASLAGKAKRFGC